MDVIQVKEVIKDFDKYRALDQVSLSIPEGKIYGLLGPNGAGKTTLIRILNRITAPDSGEILFDGRPFEAKDIEQIGYLPEERGLYRKMKVSEQAIYLAQLKGLTAKESKRRLKIWFEKFGIMPWWNKKVEELSKGMAQKVQFICTVMHEPRLLIFDEPFSGFDPINANLLKQEILTLRDQGHTIIFSTHNMQSVEEMCDNISLINRGKVVLDGDIQLIKESYRGNSYRVIYNTPITLPDGLQEKYQVTCSQTDKYGKTTIELSNIHQHPSSVIITDLAGVGPISTFEEMIPSMNTIFIEKVGENYLPNDTSNKQ